MSRLDGTPWISATVRRGRSMLAIRRSPGEPALAGFGAAGIGLALGAAFFAATGLSAGAFIGAFLAGAALRAAGLLTLALRTGFEALAAVFLATAFLATFFEAFWATFFLAVFLAGVGADFRAFE